MSGAQKAPAGAAAGKGVTIERWTLKRSGASITIEGRTADDLPIKVTSVDHVVRGDDATIAVTASGDRFTLL